MPLFDTPWERGKCAYKLIQYMACGLPTVASDIGANRDVMVDGTTGYLVRTAEQWIFGWSSCWTIRSFGGGWATRGGIG